MLLKQISAEAKPRFVQQTIGAIKAFVKDADFYNVGKVNSNKELIKKAKENQGNRTDIKQISAESKPIETRKELY